MKQHSKISFFACVVLACVLSCNAGAAAPQRRLALVIGNASYKAQPLTNAVNDAALIAQTLQLAGFDVVGARDLDQGQLRAAFRDFTDKVASAGPGAVVFVYFSGYGRQLAGQNYLVPIATEISEAADLPARAASLSELMVGLSALRPGVAFVVLDAARPGPFVQPDQAGGLAWVQPESNMLIALSAAPGTIARDAVGPYGPYAKALAEMIREGDLTPTELFYRVRLRVHDLTKGSQVPWESSRIETQFKFFDRVAGAPARTDAPARSAQLRLQPMRALGAQTAYTTALMRDTFDAYADFLADYWQDPMTKRVRALLAVRRESITWQRTCEADQPVAYWSYLERYPLGPHVADASRRLAKIGAATTPPPKFSRMDYDIPPPLPDELEYVERPTLVLDEPAFGFEAPPSASAVFLEPPPQELLNMKPPATSAAHALPVLSLPLPAFIRVPSDPKTSPAAEREAWAMRPAIDVPGGPAKQAESSVSSISTTNRTNELAKDTRPSPVEDEVQQTKKPTLQTARQDPTNEITTRSAPSVSVAPGSVRSPQMDEDVPRSAIVPQAAVMAPAWWTDILTTGTDRVLSGSLSVASDMGTSAPSMFASASAGLTLQVWSQGIPSAQAVASASGARRAPRAAADTSPSTTQAGATGASQRPAVRSVAQAPTASAKPSRPPLDPLEPAGATDHTKPRKKPVQIKPSSSNLAARRAPEPPGATPTDTQ